MKTTKKGFTLIELIVVIAIIGVLAAILVPTMLGYVRKSKISSANSTASSVYKAINSALTELDEEGIDVGGLYYMSYGFNSNTWAFNTGYTDATAMETANTGTNAGKIDKKIGNFFADIVKLNKTHAGVKAICNDGACICIVACADSTYTGTYPGGVVTTDTYTSYKSSLTGNGEGLQQALLDCYKKYTGNSNATALPSAAADVEDDVTTGQTTNTQT